MSSKRQRRVTECEAEKSVVEELVKLLRPLTNNEIPSFLQEEQRKSSNGEEQNQTKRLELELFEQHIGPYNEVLAAAARHVLEGCLDEHYYYRTGYDRSWSRYGHHPCYRFMLGPDPDLHVWMGLFLGEENESRSKYNQCSESGDPSGYEHIHKALRDRVPALPVLELMRNILQYLAFLAASSKDENDISKDLLLFCATYGLSHAMRNVLEGKYGPCSNEDLTINTALLLPCEEDELVSPRCYPAVGIGAILGYPHVVRFAVQTLGADWQSPTGYESQGEIKLCDGLRVGGLALGWVIQSKQPDMVKCLVENGVQFRWLKNEDLQSMFELLFHIDGQRHEYGPLWLPQNYDPQEHYSMRELRRWRAKQCYKLKQDMLSAVIGEGLPMDLFLPTIDVSIDEKAMAETKAKGLEEPDRAMCKKIYADMSPAERNAREFLNAACAEYNDVTKREEQKTIPEFYQHAKDLWKDQTGAQNSRLVAFEDADPRWKLRQEKGETNFRSWWEERDPNDSEEMSDYDSD